ncbi:MAG TPA: ABC transporter ATP-binding protein [Bacteroidales bacterium]|nr:ABC transporter ATP-binding protein [Bacteroidales bacterium]
MHNNSIIQIEKLVKWFPVGGQHFTALEDINLQLKDGEFTGLVGPSGSGKTTMLNIIGSLDNPSEGDANVIGTSIKTIGPKRASELRKKHIGFIFQTYNLMPVYTVFENVEFPLLLLKMTASERKKAVMEALDWVGLTPKVKSKPNQLSGGESQRVAIARAMVKKPDMVLADEPTANLDAENSHHILKTMVQLNKDLNTTFLFATHDDKVIKYLRRIIRLEDGKVVSDNIIKK